MAEVTYLQADWTRHGYTNSYRFADSFGGVPGQISASSEFGGFIRHSDPEFVVSENYEYTFRLSPDPSWAVSTNPQSAYFGLLIDAPDDVAAEFAHYPAFIFAPLGGILIGVGGSGSFDGIYNRVRLRSFGADGSVVASLDVPMADIVFEDTTVLDFRVVKSGGLITVFLDEVEIVTGWDPGDYEGSSNNVALANYMVDGGSEQIVFSNVTATDLTPAPSVLTGTIRATITDDLGNSITVDLPVSIEDINFLVTGDGDQLATEAGDFIVWT